ncbi:DoxX family protein [Pseudosulfitobacter koreensis]|uniref:DoxX family protein n=1 Tax=Pseudosulfitobacter koreensis TaxID=2968472 RepID=A0ABT1Z4B4_9RHOB|nr:DoxX family protein [Pseudosulfitobacter koreense]MCR8827979.1 DoxX family protein [Pseudosulfitobacter koreense]
MSQLYTRMTATLDRADGLLPTLARLVFAGVLLFYFWVSAMTKLGDGFAGLIWLSDTAYVQMFPKAMEAAGYDASQLGAGYWLVAVAGTWAEFLLPLMIVVGLLTRMSALGMIVFVGVQSYVDIFGHGVSAETIGTWFDHLAGGAIADQRAFWVLILLVLVVKGAGPISVDAAIRSAFQSVTPKAARVSGVQPR